MRTLAVYALQHTVENVIQNGFFCSKVPSKCRKCRFMDQNLKIFCADMPRDPSRRVPSQIKNVIPYFAPQIKNHGGATVSEPYRNTLHTKHLINLLFNCGSKLAVKRDLCLSKVSFAIAAQIYYLNKIIFLNG